MSTVHNNQHETRLGFWQSIGSAWRSGPFAKIIIVVCALFFVYGAFQASLLGVFYVKMSGDHQTPRTWWDDRVEYTTIPRVMLTPDYERRFNERVLQLVDSIWQIYEFAQNLPEKYGSYEIRYHKQEPFGDSVAVLQYVDFYLSCDCPEEMDNFWLLRLGIDPNNFSIYVYGDVIRTWQSYVPQYIRA